MSIEHFEPSEDKPLDWMKNYRNNSFIIPDAWFKVFWNGENGDPDFNSIMILSEMVRINHMVNEKRAVKHFANKFNLLQKAVEHSIKYLIISYNVINKFVPEGHCDNDFYLEISEEKLKEYSDPCSGIQEFDLWK